MEDYKIFLVTLDQKQAGQPSDVIIWADDESKAKQCASNGISSGVGGGEKGGFSGNGGKTTKTTQTSQGGLHGTSQEEGTAVKNCRKLDLDVDYIVVGGNQQQVNIKLLKGKEQKLSLPKNTGIDFKTGRPANGSAGHI